MSLIAEAVCCVAMHAARRCSEDEVAAEPISGGRDAAG